MGCNQYNIKEFLSKFWEGETTLEEEKQIHNFFKYNTIPEELQDDANYFNTISSFNNENTLGKDFDTEMLSLLDNPSEEISYKATRVIPFYKNTFFRIAAAFILVFGIGWLATKDSNKEQLGSITQQERIEAEKAFQETKDALMFISTKMNVANKHSQKLNKINKIEGK